MQVRS